MESRPEVTGVVDLAAVAAESDGVGPAWAYQHPAADLNATLLVWDGDAGVPAHVNAEVDVLLVGISGTGIVEVEGQAHELRAGQSIVVPKGTRRAIRSAGGRFAYLSCHRRRGGLWPARRRGES